MNSADENVTGQKMADTAIDGLLLGGGICHITSSGSKEVPGVIF